MRKIISEIGQNVLVVLYCIGIAVIFIVYIVFLPFFARFSVWDQKICSLFDRLIDRMPTGG